jgi:hypothetical protein
MNQPTACCKFCSPPSDYEIKQLVGRGWGPQVQAAPTGDTRTPRASAPAWTVDYQHRCNHTTACRFSRRALTLTGSNGGPPLRPWWPSMRGGQPPSSIRIQMRNHQGHWPPIMNTERPASDQTLTPSSPSSASLDMKRHAPVGSQRRPRWGDLGGSHIGWGHRERYLDVWPNRRRRQRADGSSVRTAALAEVEVSK